MTASVFYVFDELSANTKGVLGVIGASASSVFVVLCDVHSVDAAAWGSPHDDPIPVVLIRVPGITKRFGNVRRKFYITAFIIQQVAHYKISRAPGS